MSFISSTNKYFMTSYLLVISLRAFLTALKTLACMQTSSISSLDCMQQRGPLSIGTFVPSLNFKYVPCCVFEEYAMSLSVLNPSLCHLLPFCPVQYVAVLRPCCLSEIYPNRALTQQRKLEMSAHRLWKTHSYILPRPGVFCHVILWWKGRRTAWLEVITGLMFALMRWCMWVSRVSCWICCWSKERVVYPNVLKRKGRFQPLHFRESFGEISLTDL